MVTKPAGGRRCAGGVAAIALVGFMVPGARLVAQGSAVGSTPEDSVRAVEALRGQALLPAVT